MNDDEQPSADQLGVSGVLLEELGRVVVAGARLEMTARDISHALAEERSAQKVSGVIKAIRQACLTRGVPEWSRIDPPVILQWCQKASNTMDRRNQLLHSAIFSQEPNGDVWVPMLFNARDQSRGPLRIESVRSIVKALRVAIRQGTDIEIDLLPRLAPSVYVRCLPRNEVAVGVVRTDDPHFPRPDEQAIRDFVAAFDAKVVADGGFLFRRVVPGPPAPGSTQPGATP